GAGERYTDAVVLARHGREVADYHERVGLAIAVSRVAEDAVPRVVGVDPGKAAAVEVVVVRGRLATVQGVQVLHPAEHAGVVVRVEQLPVELRVVDPLAPLPELAAHE